MIMPAISEPVLRLAAFASVFLVMALLELAIPKRPLHFCKVGRWRTNLVIVALGSLVGRLLGWASTVIAVPLVAVLAAEVASAHGWGLLNIWRPGPEWFAVVIAVIVLDFAIYLQHVISHKVPMFWKLHRVHHADVDIDVTTAIRFHPIEIGLSALYKSLWVLALGPSPFAVVIFEVVLNACAVFNHANVELPRSLDHVLRLLVVTPDMHRVHHSVVPREHHSNFGFNLSIWDRLFSTYTGQPQHGHAGMTIGLSDHQNARPTELAWSLALPFMRARDPS